jgi:ketosteroid isomerase-like protein
MLTGNPETAVKEFFRLFNTGDVDAVLAMYEPQAILVAQDGQLAQGTTRLRAALNGFLSLKPTLTIHHSRLVVAGDLALSLVRWSLSGTGPDAKPVYLEGTTSDVLRRQGDGTWLFVIDNPWGATILG